MSNPRTSFVPRRRTARIVLPFLALFFVVGGCGVGEVTEFPAFQIQAVGVEGGVVQGGDIKLVIPPGALNEDTVVSILPQLDPFIIAPTDPCTYTYLGPLWCCGPVGHPLAVDGVITIVYDETLIPAGFTEADLVLLTWDETAMVLEPNFAAVQDDVANTFMLTTYAELGHVAVGIRDCSRLAVVFGGVPGLLTLEAAVTQGGDEPQDGLYVHNVVLDTLPPVLLPVAFAPTEFVPSPDGTHVLYEEFRLQSAEIESSFGLALMSAPTDAGLPVQIAGDPNEQLTFTGDPFWGWLRSAGGQYAYFEQFLGGSQDISNTDTNALVLPNTDQYAYSRAIGDGSMLGVPLHGINANTSFTTDSRQSPDGSHMLIRYENFSQQGELIDIIESDSQAVLSAGLIPVGGGLFTPRFSPDGSSVYLVSADRMRVEQYPLNWDGIAPPTILFQLGPNQFFEQLLDFIVSDDGGHFTAIVRRDITTEEETFLFDDFIYLGDFPGPGAEGQVLDIYNMGLEFFYDEVYMHPSGSPLYIQRAFPFEVVPFELLPNAASTPMIAEHPALPIDDLASMDINRENGLLLLSLGRRFTDDFLVDMPTDGSANAEFPSGLCYADPLGTNITHVETLLGLGVTNARWLFSVRTTPGMRRSEIR